MNNRVQTFIIDFPEAQPKEVVTQNDDGSYSIFLNAKQSSEQQKKSWLHAMRHITNQDFDKENVQEIENDAH